MIAALLLAAVTNLTGIVTFDRGELPFFFMDDDAGTHWRIERKPGVAVAVGDRVAVSGEREPTVKHRLAEVVVKRLGEKAPAPSPLEIAIPKLLARILPIGNTDLYGGMVVTEGLLRDINRRQTTTQLLVGEGENNLMVEIPWALEDTLPADLVLGATVRVCGVLTYTSIENVEEQIFGRIENIELIPNSPAAVEVIRRAPFWTAARLWLLVGGILFLTASSLIWVVALRRMVAIRSRELEDSVRQRVRVKIEADAARRERLRLAADLHDGFQQYLAGAMFRLKAAQNYLPEDATESRAHLEKVKVALQHTQNGLRSTLWAMSEESEGPESLLELFAFVSRRMQHWEKVVEISSEGEERKIAHNFAGTLLLILQEAVGNAITHGGATKVRVTVSFLEKELRMTVADNGCGFDVTVQRNAGHYGLAGMERRAAELGGRMILESSPGAGATLTFTIPE